jgi:drug/metabolite transporter (DMT)-like permease
VAVLLLAPALIVDQPWTGAPPSLRLVLVLVSLGALSTALAYFLYFRLLAGVGATNTSLVTLLVPVSTIVLGVLLHGERLEPHRLAGMAAIAIGLVTIDGRAERILVAWRTRRKKARANERTCA